MPSEFWAVRREPTQLCLSPLFCFPPSQRLIILHRSFAKPNASGEKPYPEQISAFDLLKPDSLLLYLLCREPQQADGGGGDAHRAGGAERLREHLPLHHPARRLQLVHLRGLLQGNKMLAVMTMNIGDNRCAERISEAWNKHIIIIVWPCFYGICLSDWFIGAHRQVHRARGLLTKLHAGSINVRCGPLWPLPILRLPSSTPSKFSGFSTPSLATN